MPEDFLQVIPQKGFTAAERDPPRAQGLQLGEALPNLIAGQFVSRRVVCAAIAAAQVAAERQVPFREHGAAPAEHHDRKPCPAQFREIRDRLPSA
jgi:hypothetical protein